METDDLTPMQQLPGAYTTALLTDKGLQVLADRSNQFPLYYKRETDGKVLVTSHPSAVGKNIEPDPISLSSYIFTPDVETYLDRSGIVGFSRLTPGNLLITNNETHIEPFDIVSPDPTKKLDTAAEELREALKAAVAQRFTTGNVVTSDMSGGKDSSSLAFLAAHETETRGHNRLSTFTSFDPHFPDGDKEYAEFFSTLHPNLDFEAIHIGTRMPEYYEGHDVPHAEDPTHQLTAYAFHFLKTYCQRVTQKNGHIHLQGHGGDEVLGAHSLYLADLIRSGNIGKAVSNGFAVARLNKYSPLHIWQRSMLAAATSPQTAMRNLAYALENPPTQPHTLMRTMQFITPPNEGIHWMGKNMRRQLADCIGDSAHELAIPDGWGLADYKAWTGMQAAGRMMTRKRLFLEASGSSLSLHAPFLDRDVVNACLSLPAHARADPYHFKLILTKALEGVIPPEVLNRQSKGEYTRTAFSVIQNSAPHLRALFQESYLADLGIIEPRAVQEALDRLELTYQFPTMTLSRIIATEMWLRGLDGSTFSKKVNSTANFTPTKPEKKPDHAQAGSATPQLTIPSHIHTATQPGGELVVLNLKTDTYHPLNKTATGILQTIATTGSTQKIEGELLAAHPSHSSSKIQQDIAACVSELRQLGIISESKGAFTPRQLKAASAPELLQNTEIYVALPKGTPRGKWPNKLLALGGLSTGLALERLAPQARLSFLQYLQRWAVQDASQTEAAELLDAAHAIGRFWIGRLACVEEAYATALAMALKRRHVTWHRGVTTNPLRFHSWIEAQGQPVSTIHTDSAEGFQSFFG